MSEVREEVPTRHRNSRVAPVSSMLLDETQTSDQDCQKTRLQMDQLALCCRLKEGSLQGTILRAMNSLEFDALRIRIIECLKHRGPTTSQKLATELGAPSDNVRFALEQIRDGEDKFVTLLPFGLWALIDDAEVAA